MNKLQKGFSAIELLLILVIAGIVGGTGYFVYNSQKQTNKTLTSAGSETSAVKSSKKSSANVTTVPSGSTETQKFFTIKEWGVRAPYDGSLHLTYAINNIGGTPALFSASMSSQELLANGNECVKGGGVIERAYANTVLDEAGTTGATANKIYATAHIGDTYYVHIPYQGLCANNLDIQDQTKNAVDEIVKHLDVAP